MAPPKYKKPEPRPTHGSPARAEWGKTNATMIAGQGYIDGLDHVAIQMEQKWGADRLRLLVEPDLREKFDRQRYLLNQAIWSGNLEDVRVETNRMIKAWQVLDRTANNSGQEALSPLVWEIALKGGKTLALVRTNADANHVRRDGRAMTVWSLEEVAHMIEAEVFVQEIKSNFLGTVVTKVRQTVGDPLRGIDSDSGLDDEIPFG